jgi:N-acetylmuramoyl-L-alanine amidase
MSIFVFRRVIMRKKLAGLPAVIVGIILLFSISASAELDDGYGGRGLTVIELFYDGEHQLYVEETITLYINDLRVEGFEGEMPPLILNDRVYLPVRDVFEMFGAVVTWNEHIGQVFIGYEGSLVSLRAGAPMMNVEGELVAIPLPPININGRMMAPVSFVAAAFGFEVSWCGETRTVTVDSGKPLPVTEPYDYDGYDYDDPDDDPDGGDLDDVPPYENGVTVIDINVSTGPIHLDRSIDASPEPLAVMDFPKTGLIGIDYDAENPRAFYINASGPISRVEKFLLPDNRLVLDFYNMEKILEGAEFAVNSQLLQRLRVGQNQVTPELITRVVFDLLEPVSYSVTFSEDRQTVIVSLLRNEITDVRFETDGISDFILIDGRHTPVVNIFPQTVPGVFIIDVPLGYVNRMMQTLADGVFVSNVRTVQFTPAAVRISVEMKGAASYDVTYFDNTTIVRLIRPTYRNISYDSYTSRLTIPKSPYLDLDINRIIQSDEYLNFEYVFTLPGDFGGHFGEGNLIVRDRFINRISITTVNGRTNVRFHQSRIMAYVIWEDEYNIYIQAMLPRDKYSRIVVIDPGHGGGDPGTQHNRLVEKHLNLDIALRLASLLENNGIKTYLTRKTDVGPSIADRAALANEVGDLFVVIHNNAYYNSRPHGTETFFWPHENESAFGITSERASEIILRNIVSAIGLHNRGSKEHPYRVLRYSNIPSVFIEYAFLSNPNDAARLRSAEFLQRCAEGTFRGIQEIFRAYTPRR